MVAGGYLLQPGFATRGPFLDTAGINRLRVTPLSLGRPFVANTNTVIRVPRDAFENSVYGFSFIKDGLQYCPSPDHPSWYGGYPYAVVPLGCVWDAARGRYACFYDYYPQRYFSFFRYLYPSPGDYGWSYYVRPTLSFKTGNFSGSISLGSGLMASTYSASTYIDARYEVLTPRRVMEEPARYQPPPQPKEEQVVAEPAPAKAPETPRHETPQTEAYASTLSPMLGGPDRVGLSFLVGEDYLRRGDSAQAARYFQRAMIEQPEEPANAVGLGLAEMLRGEFGRAARALRRGLADHTKPGLIRVDPVAVFGSAARYDLVLAHLNEMLATDRNNADLHLAAGFWYMTAGKWSDAARHFDRAEELMPADEAAARFRAVATALSAGR